VSGFTASSNVRDVAADFHTAAASLADLEAVNAQAGRVVVSTARPPRRTGATAAGLFATATPAGVAMASRARYWTFPHFGTRYVRANPYLVTAVRAAADEVAALYTDHARSTLDTIG